MIIKALTKQQVPLLIPLAQEFYATAGLPGSVDPEIMVSMWQMFIDSGVGDVFGAFDGGDLVAAIGCYRVPNPYDGETELNEMFWYCLEEKRGMKGSIKLMDAFETYGKVIGAKRITMVHLANKTGEKVGRLYGRRGYRPLETHWVKEI